MSGAVPPVYFKIRPPVFSTPTRPTLEIMREKLLDNVKRA
jgi:hypothetical protein